MDYQITGTALERYLSERGMLPAKFCKEMHISTNTYDKIVRGEKVSITTLFVLAHKTGLTLNDFLA
ncbi:MAG: helix-turn-helix transcriptional regulator [Christensenellaceae bacterium]